MTDETTDITTQLSWRKILVPVLLGLVAAGGLLWWNLQNVTFVAADPSTEITYKWIGSETKALPNTSNEEEFRAAKDGSWRKTTASELLADYHWHTKAIWALLAALLMVALRDLGYMYRIRLLTDKFFSWRKSFDVIMLWEFSSALTPSVVGGSGVAIFVLNREGINLGKSTAVIFITALLDELFYIVSVPLVILFIGTDNLFPKEPLFDVITPATLKTLFYAGYGFILVLTTMILLGIFYFPNQTKRLLVGIFSFKLIRRWRHKVAQLGDEIILASKEFRGKNFWFWFKALGSTVLSWGARFLTLNFILLAFVGNFNHIEVIGRQLVMWVILLISVTPGSSGIAELLMPAFFLYLPWEDPSLAPVLLVIAAILWRLMTYFPYLFVGAAILPSWLRRTSKKVRTSA